MRYSIRALQTFAVLSQHQSVTRAARELGVTQSAVSHQLSKLTSEVGETLIVKSGRSIKLTETGQRLADAVRSAFGQIEESIAQVVGSGRSTVRLALCSSFAPGWVIPRLSDLLHKHAEFELDLRMYARDPALTDQVADAFITALPQEAGFWSLPLRREELIAVAAPELVRLLKSGQKVPLITTDTSPTNMGERWHRLCERLGVPIQSFHDGHWRLCSHHILAYEMACQGYGVALLPDFVASGAIEEGRLQRALEGGLPSKDYYLCVKSSRKNEPHLRALIEWFEEQLALKKEGRSAA